MWKSIKNVPKKYKVLFFLGIFVTVCTVVTDLMVPVMMSSVLKILLPTFQNVSNFNWENNFGSPTGDPKIDGQYDSIISIFPGTETDFASWTYQSVLILLICSLLIVVLVGLAFGTASTFLASVVSVNISKFVRADLFTKIQNLSFEKIDRFGNSTLITRLTNDIDQVRMMILLGMRIMIRGPLLLVGGLIFGLLTSLNMSWSFLLVFPLMIIMLVIGVVYGIPVFKKSTMSIDGVNRQSRESILGIRVIKSFNLEKKQENKFNDANKFWKFSNVKSSSILPITVSSVTFVANLGVLLVLILLGYMVNDAIGSNNPTAASESLSSYQSFTGYLGYVVLGMMLTVMLIINLNSSIVSSKRINEVFKTKNSVVSSEVNNECIIKYGEVKFNNVSLNYLNNQETANALSNISFVVKPGQTVGIIGLTGSGKSSLVNLIGRLYDPTEGSIEIDGRNIKDYSLSELRHKVGFALQEAILFSGTIESNIKFSKPDATQQEMEMAAEIACAKEFIEAKPLKYQSKIEQRAKNLSGGQKQRLSLARTLLTKPKILILDDTTSALDAITEKKLRENISIFLKDTTVFLVAQRISVVKNADQIIVLENGKISGLGTHDELIKTNATYQEIVNSQLQQIKD